MPRLPSGCTPTTAPSPSTAASWVSPTGFMSRRASSRKTGGHIDPEDRSLLDAARRELAEEVGVVDPPLAVPGLFDLDIHDIPPLGSEPAHQHLDLRLAFVAPDRAVRPDISEVGGARWVPLDRVSEHESDASVMRAVGKLLR